MIELEAAPEKEWFYLNMGPQHPSTHGVLRILLKLDGEYITYAEPILGYIHRMHEKMAEVKTYRQYLPNMGRVDYLAALSYNHAYVGAVERLMDITPPLRAEFIRVITVELNRIASHLMWLGAYLLDLGAFTPIMYAFDDREQVVDILQRVTGSRLTYCYFRFGGVAQDIDDKFIAATRVFIKRLRSRFSIYEALVTKNPIFVYRSKGIGIISSEMALAYGATGPVLRGSDIKFDVRRDEPYSIYSLFDFEIPTGSGCDAYDRYLVRVQEMEQSLRIVEQAIEQLPQGPIMLPDIPVEICPPKGDCYFAVETPRGKLGLYLVSDGGPKPYRLKIRAPGFSNLSLFEELTRGALLADAVSILGSLDLVIPEIDR